MFVCQVVVLNFTLMDVGPSDKVVVYNSPDINEKPIASRCCGQIDHVVAASVHSIVLVFTTGDGEQKTGFRVTYQGLLIQGGPIKILT